MKESKKEMIIGLIELYPYKLDITIFESSMIWYLNFL